MWKFEGEGIYPFFFRGRNHDETMKSFRLNYKKALHINNDRTTNSFDLMKRLNDAFLSLGFGMKGINLNEMISLNFVERVMLDELGNIHGTINRYKRWYYGEINRYERSY